MSYVEGTQQVLDRLVGWGRSRPDVRAVVVVGSWARPVDHPADQWSDVDILLITTNPGCLPAKEALAAATRIPARMLALENEIGTVEVGKRADLVVLRKDPLHDLRNLRAVRWTIKDGVAKTPAEWLAD